MKCTDDEQSNSTTALEPSPKSMMGRKFEKNNVNFLLEMKCVAKICFWQTKGISNPLEFFIFFFDKTFIELVLEQSDEYVAQNNNQLNLIKFERYTLNGYIIMACYYCPLQSKRQYGSGEDNSLKFLMKSVKRNMLEAIHHSLHFWDNLNHSADLAYKIR